MAGREEGHELVYQIFIGETTRLHCYAENISALCFAGFHLFALIADKFAGYLLDGFNCVTDDVVALQGKINGEPVRK